MGAYRDLDAAQRRVDALKTAGRWPGIVQHPDGTCDLTWDPDGLVRM